jgi:hypothetical protein
VTLEDCRSIMDKEQRIPICKCLLLKLLDVGGYACHVHIFNVKNLLSISFHIAHCKIHKFLDTPKKQKKHRNCQAMIGEIQQLVKSQPNDIAKLLVQI